VRPSSIGLHLSIGVSRMHSLSLPRVQGARTFNQHVRLTAEPGIYPDSRAFVGEGCRSVNSHPALPRVRGRLRLTRSRQENAVTAAAFHSASSSLGGRSAYTPTGSRFRNVTQGCMALLPIGVIHHMTLSIRAGVTGITVAMVSGHLLFDTGECWAFTLPVETD
jgi:hypothetical protein